MMIKARRIAHKSQTRDGVGSRYCAGGESMAIESVQSSLIAETRAHSAACNELTQDIYEALLRVKYIRAAK